ncbi:hypothetical protein [Serpentinicella alkaliphila]|uniref:Uncharacterized protein n=1 Tax=Serpentinicella alkaliphila TaxID=1734049 RepID=A0A4R2U3M1_9FIRM|nr:hypothetical protein [Serpentinicella alkaliphila]QUH25181.1 hypothetical protein HZR23_05015 [Serpentinicella alkaliphila]TCQ02273.1 hypothetical protein EDD79_101748 [Serpentinicella alkaliphila]
MLKKFMVCLSVLFLLISLSAIAHANPENKIVEEPQTFFRLNNLTRNLTTNDPNLFVSFNASEKSTVTISVFHNTSLANDEEKFVLVDEPVMVEVGTIQRGFTELVLRKGTNKIEFKVDFEKGEELIVNRVVVVRDIEEVKKQLTDSVVNPRDAIKNIFIATGTNSKP